MIATINNPVQRAIEAIDKNFSHADFLAKCFKMDLRYTKHPKFNDFSFVGNLYRRKISFDRKIVEDLWNRILSEASRDHVKSYTLSPKDEIILFEQYNYARKRLSEYFQKAQTTDLSLIDCQKAYRWAVTLKDTYDTLVVANLGLVTYIWKYRFQKLMDQDGTPQWEKGFIIIMRCVERFDVSRGIKFSSYACRSIIQCFGEMCSNKKKEIPVDFTYELESKAVERDIGAEEEVISLKTVLETNAANLDESEKLVLKHRYGLGDAAVMTLDKLADIVFSEHTGDTITKERVRQIQEKALGKLREVFNAN